ncbi:MAG: hypothetical protein C0626_04330 [Arcobacter sp.]|uniref:hypothetical protein n=1 Tax=uncultured Arcobacter sp. TaxID=165434 RepID=UPI000CC3E153|nr:hypothetical protein [uncultured Arcobacter sp.]PLY10865.1 MAG: hypothetical protein C0626_04330 [Arcobacter sp.]
MLTYLIIFAIVGFIIAKVIKEPKKSFFIILCISIVSGFFYTPMWALVSFAEMALGYFVVYFTKD